MLDGRGLSHPKTHFILTKRAESPEPPPHGAPDVMVLDLFYTKEYINFSGWNLISL